MDEGVVAAGGLAAAFDDMAGRIGPGQPVPVAGGPVEAPGRRPATRAASATRPQTTMSAPWRRGLGDSPSAQVGIGRDGHGAGLLEPHSLVQMNERFPFSWSSASRGMRSSPSIWAIFGCRPSFPPGFAGPGPWPPDSVRRRWKPPGSFFQALPHDLFHLLEKGGDIAGPGFLSFFWNKMAMVSSAR